MVCPGVDSPGSSPGDCCNSECLRTWSVFCIALRISLGPGGDV